MCMSPMAAARTGLSDGVNIEIKSGLKVNEVVRGPKKIESAD